MVTSDEAIHDAGQLVFEDAADQILRPLLRVATDSIAECVLVGGTGATLHISGSPEVALFSEDQGRAVVTCAPENVEAVLAVAREGAVPAAVIGRTGGDRLRIADVINVSIESLRAAWEHQA